MHSDASGWSRQARIKIIRDDNWIYVRPTSLENLARFEKKFKFQLPKSYRDFVHTVGAGTLAGLFEFLTPFAELSTADLVACNAQQQKELKQVTKYSGTVVHQPQLQRMIHFCTNYLRHSFAWDPQDVTDSDTHECGIYFVSRRPEQPPERIATRFDDFIQKFCLGGGYEQKFGGAALPPKRRMRQYYPRKVRFKRTAIPRAEAEEKREARRKVEEFVKAFTARDANRLQVARKYRRVDLNFRLGMTVQARKITKIDLSDVQLRQSDLPAVLQAIARETDLYSLQIGSGLTDAALRPLRHLRSLKELYLSGSSWDPNPDFRGQGLQYLKGLQNLEYLHIECPRLTNKGLLHLPPLPGLKSFYLSEMEIEDRCLRHLAMQCPALEHILLFDTKLVGKSFASLSMLQNLTELIVGGSCITD